MQGDGGRHRGDIGSYSEVWPAAAEQRARARERVDGRELRELIDPLLAHGVQRVWVLGAGLRLSPLHQPHRRLRRLEPPLETRRALLGRFSQELVGAHLTQGRKRARRSLKGARESVWR